MGRIVRLSFWRLGRLVGAVLALATIVAFAGGCATSASEGAVRESRASAALPAGPPRMLVAGPAFLLHADLEGREGLGIYAVHRVRGTDQDCDAAEIAASQPELLRWTENRINLRVRADQVICLRATAHLPASELATIVSRASLSSGTRRIEAREADPRVAIVTSSVPPRPAAQVSGERR